MNTAADNRIADMGGRLALPRENGELVFDTPWEGRAFGVAVTMSENGLYEWGEFQQHLAEEIGLADQSGERPGYYEQWLAALEKLVTGKGFVTSEELDARKAEYASGERDDDDR